MMARSSRSPHVTDSGSASLSSVVSAVVKRPALCSMPIDGHRDLFGNLRQIGRQQHLVVAVVFREHVEMVVGMCIEYEHLVHGRNRLHRRVQFSSHDSVIEIMSLGLGIMDDQVQSLSYREAKRSGKALGNAVTAVGDEHLIFQCDLLAEIGEGAENTVACSLAVEQHQCVVRRQSETVLQHTPDELDVVRAPR